MWNEVEVLKGNSENVIKFIFKKEDAIAEAVLYKYPTYNDRTVICVSTQSGCPVGCAFCGTGDKFIRNLTSNEIVYQIAAILQSQNIEVIKVKRFQIMYMSMGEPMLNYKHLKQSIKEVATYYPLAQQLISTSAPESNHWNDLVKLSIEYPQIGLQFSVHESNDETRNKLIPFKKKLSLEKLAAMGLYWGLKTGRKPFFNYCVHENNNKDEDITNLYNLFNPALWEATLSVISERDETIKAAIERQENLALNFSNKMLEKGFSVRVFNPAGQDDIGGGCGQLFAFQNWAKDKKALR